MKFGANRSQLYDAQKTAHAQWSIVCDLWTDIARQEFDEHTWQPLDRQVSDVLRAIDQLSVVFWRDKDMSGDVIVRPDGMISLPLINEVQAAGLTPDQLRLKLAELAGKYLEEPTPVVVVKTINSRKVFITGMVSKIGAYPLTSPTTVVQLITMAGGLLDFADEENIVVLRTENGRQTSYRFNYKDVVKRQKLTQNIQLQPGDTVVVP